MKSNSTRNKIYRIHEQSQADTYTVSLQTDIKRYLLRNLTKTNVLNNIISVPYGVGEDFSVLTPFLYDDDEVEEAYKIWTVEFPFMHPEWISGIKPIIVKKYGEDSTGELQDTSDVKENFIIGIEDIESSSIIKKVTLSASYVIKDYYGVQDDIQVKLLVNMPTPSITI